MQVKIKKYIGKYIMYSFLACVFLLLSLFFYKKCSDATKPIIVSFNENTDIDYNICLKENNFFDDECLNKNYIERNQSSIITKLINSVDATFNHILTFSEPVSGDYSYYLKAIIEANKTNQEIGNYWSKEYNLTEKKSFSIDDTKEYMFSVSTSINYDQYNDLLNQFKNDFNISVDGILKIVLVVDTNAKGKSFTKTSNISTQSILQIPLSKNSVELSINTVNGYKDSFISESFTTREKDYNHFCISLIFSYILTAFNVVAVIITDYKRRKENKEYLKLKKILNTYDGIIVTILKHPDISKYNVIKVKDFQELIDAHSEVRLPINYFNHKNKHRFMLINNDVIYIYDLFTHFKEQKNETI